MRCIRFCFSRDYSVIRCNLSRIMGDRKMKIADVARESRLNRSTITKLYYETAERVDLHAIDALCSVFHCQVGDLFEYVPDEGAKQ